MKRKSFRSIDLKDVTSKKDGFTYRYQGAEDFSTKSA